VTTSRSPGSTKETVKTIAQGRPDELGEPVVTNSCAFHLCARGCGCIEHPAFPAPSVFLGERIMHSSGASRRENAKPCPMNTSAILFNRHHPRMVIQ
jgi:hypothetical protein